LNFSVTAWKNSKRVFNRPDRPVYVPFRFAVFDQPQLSYASPIRYKPLVASLRQTAEFTREIFDIHGKTKPAMALVLTVQSVRGFPERK
jgi:hypothetical protein